MALKRNLVLAASVATIGISTLGIGAVSAAQNPSKDNLVSKIASRFSLSEDDVQSVFDEYRAEHEQERKAKLENRLTKAVQNGKLSEEQKNQILTKMDENKAFFKSLKDMSKSERKTALENHRKEMKAWAKENEIDKKWAPPKHRRHHGHGHGEHKPIDEPDEQSSTDS